MDLDAYLKQNHPHKRKRRLLMKNHSLHLVILLLSMALLNAQEGPVSYGGIPADDEALTAAEGAETDDRDEPALNGTARRALYKIGSVTYISHGKTRPFALSRNISVDTYKTFASEDELKEYIGAVEQDIVNLRLLDNIETSYTLSAQDGPDENGDTIYLAAVEISFSDAYNLLMLPKFSYDSNSGAEIKLKLKDTNFLGFLNPLNVDLNLQFGDEDDSEDFRRVYTGINFDLDIPFNLGVLENSFNNDFSFQWKIGTDNDGNLNAPEFSYSTGIVVGIPFGKFNKIKLGFTQSVIRDEDYIYDGNSDVIYGAEKVTVSLPLVIGTVRETSQITYTPSITFTQNWDMDGINPDNEDLRGPELKISQSIGTSTVDWYGNLRTGMSMSISQSLGWNFFDQLEDTEHFLASISAKINMFKSFRYLGLCSQIYFTANMNSTQKIGEHLRGVRDNQPFSAQYPFADGHALRTPLAMVLSLDIPVHIVTTDWLGWGYRLWGSYESVVEKWPQGLRWIPRISHRLFGALDFELQLSPFMDIALTKNQATGKVFSLRDGFYSAGIEALIYPEKWKNFVVRVSLGMDVGRQFLGNYINTDWRAGDVKTYELFFGLGRHF